MRRGPLPGTRTTADAVKTLRSAWGEAAPDWLFWLAEECNRTSAAATAKLIGYSSATVSNLLHNKFKGNLEALEQAVGSALRAETVFCETLETALPGLSCLEWQRKARKFASTSPLRVQMYRACRGQCPHSRVGTNRK